MSFALVRGLGCCENSLPRFPAVDAFLSASVVRGFRAAASSPEPRCAAAHDFALAYQLGIEFAAVEGEIDIEVDTVESALRGVHALKVLFEILAREVGGEGDDFLDTCCIITGSVYRSQKRY